MVKPGPELRQDNHQASRESPSPVQLGPEDVNAYIRREAEN